METLKIDIITPIEWLTDNDIQEFDDSIVMWQTHSTHKQDADDTNDD